MMIGYKRYVNWTNWNCAIPFWVKSVFFKFFNEVKWSLEFYLKFNLPERLKLLKVVALKFWGQVLGPVSCDGKKFPHREVQARRGKFRLGHNRRHPRRLGPRHLPTLSIKILLKFLDYQKILNWMQWFYYFKGLNKHEFFMFG